MDKFPQSLTQRKKQIMKYYVIHVGVIALLLSCVAPHDIATILAEERAGRTFFVDSEGGHDDADGQSPERAWKSLERVNAADLKPGDTVRFKCGGVWRGSLIPVSGDEQAPVTYTSYGEGPKPLLLGSRPRNRPEDWVHVGPKLWATLPVEYRLGRERLDLRNSTWRHHQEAGAQVELTHEGDADNRVVRVTCIASGSAANHIQLWGPAVAVQKGEHLVFTFRARSSKPFMLPPVNLLKAGFPYSRYAQSTLPKETVGPEWATYQIPLRASESAEDGRLHINLGGIIPAGAIFEFQAQTLHEATPSVPDPLDTDVGNIIFDNGAICGWKKWSLDSLEKPYDFFYDGTSQRVFLFSEVVPTATHRSIELALTRHVVNQSGKHHVIYDGLAVMYGAAHGFGGGGTHHIIIRNCDLAYIGGGHQHTRPDGKPVRYGNAIEFWGAAHDNLVEGCRIWEVYDAALTNQGRGTDSHQVNITYRNNFIRNAEYSFEYWNNPEEAVTENIRFINNTCVDAGKGWAHAQRPDPNGSHLMFYTNTAATKGIEIKYNIFAGFTDWGSRYSSGWKVLPDMDYNLWFSTTGVMVHWFGEKIPDFDTYRQKTGLDAHSVFADPRFVCPAEGDYRLAPDSPARTLRPDGGPVGATMFWE